MKALELKLVKVLLQEEGVSKSTGNPWQKRDIIVASTREAYNKDFAVTLWGEQSKKFATMGEGSLFDMDLIIESREYNGRYYTSVQAAKIYPIKIIEDTTSPSPTKTYKEMDTFIPNQEPSGSFDDLPF